MLDEEKMKAYVARCIEHCKKIAPYDLFKGSEGEFEAMCLAAMKAGVGVFLDSLWHDASEEPRKGANCILYVSCEFEQNPEDNYHEYTTAVYLGGGFSEDHFPSEADVYTIEWAYLDDILPKKGGEE